MAKPLIEKKQINIAILGMTPGNGHPYSWSAMFNGYDKECMANECPYAGIPDYLNKQPPETLTIPDANITHICCTGEGDFTADHVAKCSLIPNVVDKPEDVIGKVDAVIVATDIGSEHVERCRPFVEAGLPLFVDKPMVDNPEDLAVFNQWMAEGKPILSSSSMRYTKEFMPYRVSTHNLGQLRYVTITTAKWWETYGIHALEGIFPIMGPGFETCRNTGTKERNIVHFTHKSGADAVVVASKDMTGGFGLLTLAGTKGCAQLKAMDSFFSFKSQLEAFVQYLRTGERPFPYAETEELMRMVIAGIQSREAGGKEIRLKDIL
ncbi:MAG: Gfo/Idh/MocA family oxidoreductase [Spirochaetia bacterium]